ncbi:acyltransferase [Tuberibacillus sp. Marseille-P3662]|uniref:acyltransferase n=1 Tax=Tuberibacillus sp. Marseille-P3662 TaxID=1965358 RepID=UPI000A1C8E01|nr:acyltransferase [Tuberibacillus sp. Marseille-P3662]
MRRTKRYKVQGANSLWQLYRTVPFFKVAKNFFVIQVGRYTPSVRVKRWLYQKCLRMTIGEKTALAVMVMPDILFPEMISIGRNSIVGYHSTLLAHEYLIDEYRLGAIEIGDEVMIGANCTVLPGVTIGNGAIISAGTLVHKDVPAGAFVGGNPMTIVSTKEERDHRDNKGNDDERT